MTPVSAGPPGDRIRLALCACADAAPATASMRVAQLEHDQKVVHFTARLPD